MVTFSEFSVTNILFHLGCYSGKKKKFVIKQELIRHLLVPGDSVSGEPQERLSPAQLVQAEAWLIFEITVWPGCSITIHPTTEVSFPGPLEFANIVIPWVSCR